MRRSLAVLTALLLASPTFAGRVAVVPPYTATNSTVPNSSYAERAQVAKVCEMLDVMGVDYDIIPNGAMRTLYAQTGTVNFEGGLSRNYVAFIHPGWQRGGAGTHVAGWKPDSLWLGAKWSAVPQLFIAHASSAAQTLAQGTVIVSCSTGVASPTAFFTTANTAGNSGTAYLLNGPEVWHEAGGDNALYNNTYVRNGINGNGPDYFVRTIVALNSWPPVDQYQTYTNPDGLTRKTQATADTFQLMARYRTNTDGSASGVPIIFCASPNASAGANAAMGLQAMAIAALDSASRAAGAVAAVPYDGRIIGVKAGWQPKKVAVYISRAFARGRPRAAASGQEAKGWYCYADSCDSSFFKASIDSLESLGIPFTVGVNIDSVNTYPAEKAWWARLSKVEYSPESWSGISTNVGDSLQVTPTRLPDIFGFRRTRTLMPTGRLPGTACADGDTSLSCILTLARDRLKTLGFPYLSRALLAPNGDYIPLNYSRANMPPLDSLGVALLSAGYDHLVAIATPVQTSDVQFAVSAGGVFAGGQTNAFTLGGYERKVPIYTNASHTTRVGNLTFAMTRGFMDDPQTDDDGTVVDPMVSLNGHLHPHGNEQMQGVWGKVWYGNDIPYYFHTFRTSTSVYMIRAGGLGHAGNPTVSATRPEYFHLKWFVNQCKAVNRLAGRTVIQFVQVDDL